MRIGGVGVSVPLVAELVSLLRDDYYDKAADTLENALGRDALDVGLTINERNAILDVLDDPPAGLEELRSVLLEEYVWRVRHGLESRARVN